MRHLPIGVSSAGDTAAGSECRGRAGSGQEAAALPWLHAPLPALETIDRFAGKAFPVRVYFALQGNAS